MNIYPLFSVIVSIVLHISSIHANKEPWSIASGKEPWSIASGFMETYKTLKSLDKKDPLEWKTNNPLATHDATKDQQDALRHWFMWSYQLGLRELKFRFGQLLSNPTVDFSIDNFRALQLVAHIGDERAVYYILDKFPKEISDFVRNETLIRAASSHNLRLVVSLIDEYGIIPNNNAFISAVRSGDLEITQYLLLKLGLTRISWFTIHCAEVSGNLELIKFLNDYNNYNSVTKDLETKVLEKEEKKNRFQIKFRTNKKSFY